MKIVTKSVVLAVGYALSLTSGQAAPVEPSVVRTQTSSTATPATPCSSPTEYRQGEEVNFRAARIPDASGIVSSVTYSAPTGAVVVVTKYHFDTSEQTRAEAGKITDGAVDLGIPARCGECAARGNERRFVLHREKRGPEIIRIVDFGYTVITSAAVDDVLNVECLLFAASQAAPTPAN